ncbi:ABC transporter permease [Rossellomorea vietnamensis]|uniref:ABC transporter permease n=1 Tax=Rossellomorea vietnamensis TaxID=218284 RepID=UPI001E410615|nr:ABC transporter permease [Rossellomorea vietnamensis]MCC5800551.1 ABC transporter permease [Rossellomorea vietnamensis]
MKVGWVLFRKEMLELIRNYKMIWMPFIFILFGLTEPLTAYYMPEILQSVGDLPDGTVISIPTPSAGEVLLSIMNQFSTLGVLVIVLGFMGTVAGERKSGNAILVLVKPVPYSSYIYSKWSAAFVLVWVSYSLGMLSGMYYIHLLFDGIDLHISIQGFLVYGLWLTFIMTLVIFFSSLVQTPGLAAFYTIASTMLITFFSGYMTKTLKWSPGQLISYVNDLILQDRWTENLSGTIYLTLAICLTILILTPTLSRKKELS